MYEPRDSVYCYKGTEVLKNKLGLRDKEQLKQYERLVVSVKLFELEKYNMWNTFDVNHFVNIHTFLFDEIYEFAGKFRNEDIAKDNFKFACWEYIESELLRLFAKLKEEKYLEGLNKEVLASRLAYYMSELNVLHPFREGNGRAIREFIRQLAKRNGYKLNFNNVSAEEMLMASIKSVTDTKELEEKIFNCLTKI